MKDALNDFGTITLTGSASAVILSSDVIDFGPIDGRASAQTHRTGEQHDSTVVFALSINAAAAITAIKLQHSDDNSTFADLLAGPAIAAATKAGDAPSARSALAISGLPTELPRQCTSGARSRNSEKSRANAPGVRSAWEQLFFSVKDPSPVIV